MKITNHYLAEMAGWHRIHYWDFVRPRTPGGYHGLNMYQWVQDNVPAERWVSWNGDMWFKDSREAAMFALVWAQCVSLEVAIQCLVA